MIIFNTLELNNRNNEFKLELLDDIVVIGGKSGSGKTYLINAILELDADSEYANKINIYNNFSSKETLEQLGVIHNKLIVIDNTERVIDKCLKNGMTLNDVIRRNDNQYIILTRKAALYGIGRSSTTLFESRKIGHGKHFLLRYPFREIAKFW